MQTNFYQTNNYQLAVKAITWNKDSHSLFDYQSTKTSTIGFNYPLAPKVVSFYRKKQSSNVVAYEDFQEPFDNREEFQLLLQFEIKLNPLDNKVKLQFLNNCPQNKKKITNQRLNTNQSGQSINNKKEDAFFVVRKFKDNNGQQRGYTLQAGQTIKLGRVKYYVSEICSMGITKYGSLNPKSSMNKNKNILIYEKPNLKEHNTCKICLDHVETSQNVLLNPCKCAGSCGTVHIDCLLQWIHFKVKKQVIGGTLHYNFEKFQCQVCKTQLPMIIDIKGTLKQMLPIQKPEGNYMILEAACQKTKSVMMIKNIPNDGIKLGRGHECQIRITDISISRNHANIKYINNNFTIFDNNSKFGTLIRQQNMKLQLSKGNRGVQIGRTLLSFDIKKQNKNN